MDPIQVAVQAYILTLFPQNLRGQPPRRQRAQSQGAQLRSLASGLCLPSFWTEEEITEAFGVANTIWARAAIAFTPVTISRSAAAVPADENGMWAHFVNHLSPRSGIAVAFIHDLPSNEGGWGGGRVAAVAGARAVGALAGYQGRILAHELGHVLFNSPFHETSPSNLMFGRRHPRVVTADLLEPRQISQARARAQSL